MNNSVDNKTLMGTAVQNAIIAAIANLAAAIIVYALGASFRTPQFGLGGILTGILKGVVFFIPALVICIWSGDQIKKQNSSYITMKELFKYLFISFVIIETAYVLLNLVLFKFIDPDYARQVVTLSVQSTAKFLHDQGLDQDAIKDEMQKRTAFYSNMYSYLSLSVTWGILLIKDAIVALIIAAIIKKDKPAELQIPTETNTPI